MSIVVNGSGTITGISAGGLPDGSVDVDTLAANSVTAAKIVDGTIVDAEVTSLAASKLTGALPAISGASLTNLPTTDISGKLNLSGGTMTGDLNFGDNNVIQMGGGNDLRIYHDGSNSFIDDAGNGVLQIRSNDIYLQKYTGETMINGIADGAVTLYHNNAAKLATSATGINVTGAISGATNLGKVLQVVSVTAKRYTSTSSFTFVDTGVTATITPSATSSKILVFYDSGLCYQDSQVNYYAIYTMLRGSTNIGNGGGGFSGDYHYGGADWNDKGYNVSFHTLDSPSTTSATTYKIQFKVGASGGTILNDLEGYSTITLMEIAG